MEVLNTHLFLFIHYRVKYQFGKSHVEFVGYIYILKMKYSL